MSGDIGSVVITGATSGIGRATAELLARTGGERLILSGRDAARLESVVHACRASSAVEVHGMVADLGDSSAVAELGGYAASFGPVAGLVNSAGFGAFAPVQRADDRDLTQMLLVNALAPLLLCRALLKAMTGNRARSTIVNISSDADSVGFREAAGYCASKGAVRAMSRALREELRQQGVRLCTISPGRVDTNFNGKAPGMRPGALTAEQVAEVVAFCIRCHPNIELQEIRLDSLSRLS